MCPLLYIILSCISTDYRYVYNKRYASGEVSFNDPKFVECVKICMNESVQHHHAIIK